MGPVAAQPGDVIVAFHDTSVLYMLRPTAVSNYTGDDGVPKQTYEYLGEVYCHGMMHGETLEIETVEDFFLVEYCAPFILAFTNHLTLLTFGSNTSEANHQHLLHRQTSIVHFNCPLVWWMFSIEAHR